MPLEGFAGLPQWLLTGLVLGVAGSVVVAVLFYVVVRQFPAAPSEPSYEHSGEARRRGEIGRYLEAIGERYVLDHDLDATTVAFYLPDRDVAITFDAGAYYRLLRTDTEPVLVEHELPGRQLGARLPFETPPVDADAGTAGDVEADTAADPVDRSDAFDVLGVPVGASVEEVTRAYRRKVKEVHPDQGGDRDDFRRVREAYATAKRHAR